MQLELSATEEVLGIDKPPYSADPHSNPEEIQALRRGVRFRVIYDKSALEYPGKLSGIRQLMSSGEDARMLNDAPMKRAIFDRRLALVPLALDVPEDTAALLLHSSSLLNALVTFFEQLWAESTLIPLGGSSESTMPNDDLSSDDRELLVLLMSATEPYA